MLIFLSFNILLHIRLKHFVLNNITPIKVTDLMPNLKRHYDSKACFLFICFTIGKDKSIYG
jgi:hypothetical protein